MFSLLLKNTGAIMSAASSFALLCLLALCATAAASAQPVRSRTAAIDGFHIVVEASPKTVRLAREGLQQFRAEVRGAGGHKVVWSMSPSIGTLSADGLYQAPAVIAEALSVTVRATSSAHPEAFDEALIELSPAAPDSITAASGAISLSVPYGQSLDPPVAGVVGEAAEGAAQAEKDSAALGRMSAAYSPASGASATANAFASEPVPMGVYVSPGAVKLLPSQFRRFWGWASGLPDTGVTWSIIPPVGSISAHGFYVAPAVVTRTQFVTVRATSVIDPDVFGEALVEVDPGLPTSIAISPQSATLDPSGSQKFDALVTAAGDTTVTWKLEPHVGSLAVSGNSAVYVAPAIIEESQTIEIEARSAMNPDVYARAAIALVAGVSVLVSPGTAETNAGESIQFSAAVAGSPDQTVQWSLEPHVGSIDANGLYKAPPPSPFERQVTVIAQAAADPARSGRAQVRIKPSGSLSFTMRDRGLDTLVYQGVDYNHRYSEQQLTTLWYASPTGDEFAGHPSCQSARNGNVIDQECALNGARSKLQVAYSLCGLDTLCVDVALTNLDSSNEIERAFMSPVGFRMSEFNRDQSFGLQDPPLGPGSPVALIDAGAHRVAMWFDSRYADLRMGTQCGWQYICKSQPVATNVKPGETRTYRLHVRFTDDKDARRDELAPEAYSAYRNGYPPVINWPDRRPIVSWFIAESGHRSATNPRGYMQDRNLIASNAGIFRDRVLSRARQIRDSLNARPVRPQGLIVWDIEGQEFNHATTYIGDPRVFETGYAPEMDAVADEMFAVFRDAGYRVGVTVRPQFLGWGTRLPETCKFDSNPFLTEYYIKVDNPFRKRFYACEDPAGKTFSLFPNGNGGQTGFRSGQYEEVLELLRSKIRYAHTRWNATLFYIDSAGYIAGGAIEADILRTLQLEFPDSLFIPELHFSIDSAAAAISFFDPGVSSDPIFAPATWRFAYPEAAIAIRLPECQGDCWSQKRPLFKIGQKVGDIALYNVPAQMSAAQLDAIEQMILESRSEAHMVEVTDSATDQLFAFAGSAEPLRDYPVKMRVYFADSIEGLADSDVYCEGGQRLGETSCRIDLTGLKASQVRYYDFAGSHVHSGPPVQQQ